MSCCLLPRWGARHRFLAAPEDLDDAHGSAATGTWFAQGEWDDLGMGSWRGDLFGTLDAEQGAVDHYGPGLSVMLKGFSARLEEAGNEVLSSKIDQLIASVEAMKEDVNDH